MAFNLVRPELEPLAKNLIEMIHDALENGGGVPMLKVVEMFGIELDADERRRLTARGDIHIATDGAAVNEGPDETFKGSLVNIHLPKALRGHVHRQGAGFVLSFSDNKNGIEAKKGFVKAMVKSLTVMPERADLEMSNSMFTLHFTWK
jgi:hypothetical protein